MKSTFRKLKAEFLDIDQKRLTTEIIDIHKDRLAYGEELRHGFTETRPRRKMSRVVGIGIGQRSSGSISHSSDTWRRHRERPQDEVRGKADSRTNEVKNNRGAAFGRPLCVSIVLHFVGAAVCFASDLVLWSFPVSAPCVTAVADAAAGPLADADADDS